VLAGELAAAGGDHRVAFAAYEAQFRPWAERCQGIGAGKFLAPATRGQIWQRDMLGRMMTRPPISKLIGRMDMKAATGITLKDYEESRPSASTASETAAGIRLSTARSTAS
jgi:hypothetical protein